MQTCWFRIFYESSHVIAGQYSACEDDAARRHADNLAAKSRNSNIVLWDDDQQVLPEHSDLSPATPTRLYDLTMVSRRLHYERAKDHVDRAETRLDRQKKVVQTLKTKGRDSREAERLLELMSESLGIMRQHRRTIEDELHCFAMINRTIVSLAQALGDVPG